jgi:hypothetical protein
MKGVSHYSTIVLVSLIGCSSSPSSEFPITPVSTQLEGITREATSLVHETRSLAASTTALRNVDEVLNRATQDLDRTGRDLISRATSGAIEVVVLIAVLVVGINLLIFFIKRRASRSRSIPDPGTVDHEEAYPPPTPAGGKSTPRGATKGRAPLPRRQTRLKRRSSPGN